MSLHLEGLGLIVGLITKFRGRPGLSVMSVEHHIGKNWHERCSGSVLLVVPGCMRVG